jgi:hypothetical protein
MLGISLERANRDGGIIILGFSSTEQHFSIKKEKKFLKR